MSAKKSQTASRRLRARPQPKTLDREGLDQMARRRCLMVLDVLSGQKAVTEVIEAEKISRGTYYNLEERALAAMLAALTPGSEAPEGTPSKRIGALEQKVAELERQKRRGERLLLLTRKIVKPGRCDDGRAPALGEGWAKAFAGLPTKKAPPRRADPDDRWRGRALSWERSLSRAGAERRSGDGEAEEPTYTPSPGCRGSRRYRTVIQVLLEADDERQGRKLGLSRNRFQTLVHQGVEGDRGPETEAANKSPRLETERAPREERSAAPRERAPQHEDGRIEKMLGCERLLRSSPSLTTRASARGRTSRRGQDR
jgi:hypothetical protein